FEPTNRAVAVAASSSAIGGVGFPRSGVNGIDGSGSQSRVECGLGKLRAAALGVDQRLVGRDRRRLLGRAPAELRSDEPGRPGPGRRARVGRARRSWTERAISARAAYTTSAFE